MFLVFPSERYLVTDMLGTLTTVIVLLVMQHSQNRDMHALQGKVDELIRSSDAGNHLIGVERLEVGELQQRIADRQAD
jgi:low affinity Fe/Cu permease